ncbi:MAG: DUF3524 domain-containing protein [Tepidisphaeraceae bacterium]|jgi:hypothetical protein
MSPQLDILALEPFYGGPRKAMLDSLIKCSRHRWTLLKLPPRRIERRLVAAAHWFAEQLTLHWLGRVDLIFASEALNLADLYRLVPAIVGKPSVAYFHDNQLPAPETIEDITVPAAPSILANLSTAATANELWFNSVFHKKLFFERAKSLLERHVQNFSRNPLDDIGRKCRYMAPPTDLLLAQHVKAASSVQRDGRTLFVDMRNANVQLLDEAFCLLRERKEVFHIIAYGSVSGLTPGLPVTYLAEGDEFKTMEAMLKSGAFISARADAVWDHHWILGMSAGCWPIAPASGVYADLISKPLDERCLYDNTPGGLAYTLQDFWELELPIGHPEAIRAILLPLNSMTAAKVMDERLAELSVAALKAS